MATMKPAPRAAALLALCVLWARPAAAQLAPVRLDSLEVTVGSRSSAALPVATRAVDVLTAETIAATPARTLSDLIAWTLGVDVQPRSAAQADVALRGATFEQVLVLVDGIRVSDAQTGHFDLDLAVPLAEIERIEILRGPATALYGADAVGGVIHVVTRRGASRVEASAEAGAFGTAGVTLAAGLGGERYAARTGGEFRRSDGHRDGTDYESAQARAALDASVAGRTIRADIAFAARDFGARAFYTPPGAPFDEYEETRTATASLAWLAPAAARLALEPRLAVRRHDDDFLLRRDDPGFYRNRHTSTQLGGEIVARYAAAPALRAVLGGEAYADRLESTNLGDRREERAALFGEIAAGRVDRASVNLGVRADWHSTFGGFLAPSLAGAARVAGPLRLRASVGRAFRAPTWTERFYRDPSNIGSADLEPERAWEAELGADFDPGARVRVEASAFARRAEALIDWARPVDAAADEPWRTRNIERATFRGVELEVRVPDLLGARWSFGATALDVESEEVGGFVSRYALRPLTGTLHLSAERGFLDDALLLSGRLFHGRRAGSDEPDIQDGACAPGARQRHTRADTRVVYAWRRARVFLDIHNLTGATYCDVSGVLAPGRAAFLGIAWRPRP